MSNTSDITISIAKGERSGLPFHGAFTVKTALSFRDDVRRDAVRRDLLGGVNPQHASERALNIAHLFSEMAVRIIKAPSWWTDSNDGIDLIDENVVAAVYKAVVAEENKVLEAMKKAADEAQAELRKLQTPAG